MSLNIIKFNGFNKKNRYVQYFIELAEQTYIFIVRWCNYNNCAYLTIKSYEDIPIIMGRALTNNLIIRSEKLPYVLMFVNQNGKTYEPTLDNIASEFVLAYDDGE